MTAAAVKYNEVGESRPRCFCGGCKGEYMLWHPDNRSNRKKGGFWECLTKARNKRRKFATDLRRKLKLEFGGACVKCGYDRCLAALHWHHRDPSQKNFGVSRLKSYERLREEAEKCDLLCPNCHAEIHHGIDS